MKQYMNAYRSLNYLIPPNLKKLSKQKYVFLVIFKPSNTQLINFVILQEVKQKL